MKNLQNRGYQVRDAAPVYFTEDMERTVAWFEQVLGWYSQIDERDKEGKGTYGYVLSVPLFMESAGLVPFVGVHLFRGASVPTTLTFMRVSGIDRMRAHILDSGWTKVTDIVTESWGANTMGITTPDGYLLRCYEPPVRS